MWEKSVSWVLPRRKKIDFRSLPRSLAEALCRVRTWFGADGKVSEERLCLSLCRKTFKPELRSLKCFFFCVSGFLCSILYMCVMDIMNVLRTGMDMSISRMRIWLCYICLCCVVYIYWFLLFDFSSGWLAGCGFRIEIGFRALNFYEGLLFW